ncbi:MAG: methyltransferase domain-containing protein [Candidatus Moranbacteria bacterium]|nr:methyltransferase domain-containing protein [Candidatus Moranbacteria bacterium]
MQEFHGQFIEPEKIAKQLDLKPGEKVADLGCGPGFFVMEIAKIVGDEGKVFAIDILAKQLESVESLARTNFLFNIETLQLNIESEDSLKKLLKHGQMDKLIISNVLSENQNKSDIIKECLKLLKPGGELIIIDWQKNQLPMGPKAEMMADPLRVLEFCKKLGLSLKKEIDTGQFHWGYIFSK